MTSRALDDIRVLDLSTTASGAWCSRLLADFGADVLMIEPPGGHPLRSEAPFDSVGRSTTAEFFLANKQSLVLDPATPQGRSTILRLAKRCDVVISTAQPDPNSELGLNFSAFEQPRLVMTHVTPYGMTGPLAQVPGDELTVAARSGWASINGDASREPLRPSGHQVAFCAGTAAYAATVGALIHRDKHDGEGQEVDVAEFDVMVSTFAPALLRGEYTGTAPGRREAADITAGPVPVADGHFALTISRAHFWRDAMNLLDLPDLAEDPRWEASWYRQAHKDEYVERVQAAMAKWTKADLFDELAARRVVAGPVLTMPELFKNEHLASRHFWVELSKVSNLSTVPNPSDASDLSTVSNPSDASSLSNASNPSDVSNLSNVPKPSDVSNLSNGAETEWYPGAPFQMSATPWDLRRGAPPPGTHQTEWSE